MSNTKSKYETFSVGKEKAIQMRESKWWEGKTAEEIVRLQLFTDELCLPFGDFHGAVEKALGRPVWTHEFGFADHLRAEFLGESPAPSFEDICNLIPEEKRVVLTPQLLEALLPTTATEEHKD